MSFFVIIFLAKLKGVIFLEYRYRPSGVCSSEFIIVMNGEIIKSVKIVGGCPGNTLAVSALVEGQNINDVIARLDGIQCGMRGTSCPDQLAKALKEIKNKM